jgi:hypothetical protein
MNHLRILHNGDLRAESPQPSPHWMIHVREDGLVWGEVLTRERGRMLPDGFAIRELGRFFDIPAHLREQKLQVQPHHEEIILALVEPSGHWLCSFLMSDLPEDSRLRLALVELVQKIQKIAEPDVAGNSHRAGQ